jgi:hypothetical protein
MTEIFCRYYQIFINKKLLCASGFLIPRASFFTSIEDAERFTLERLQFALNPHELGSVQIVPADISKYDLRDVSPMVRIKDDEFRKNYWTDI